MPGSLGSLAARLGVDQTGLWGRSRSFIPPLENQRVPGMGLALWSAKCACVGACVYACVCLCVWYGERCWWGMGGDATQPLSSGNSH